MILCKVHPYYKAIRAPRVKCDDCRLAWLDKLIEGHETRLLDLTNERQEILDRMIDEGKL